MVLKFEDVEFDAGDGDAVMVEIDTGVALWEETIFPFSRTTPLPSVQHLALPAEDSQHKLPSAQVVRDTKMLAKELPSESEFPCYYGY